MSARVIRNWSAIGLVAIVAVVALGLFRTKPTDGEVVSKHAVANGEKSPPVAANEPENSSRPRVVVIKPKANKPTQILEEPGIVEAFEYATLYAKVSGYLDVQTLDIGDEVKKDEVVAKLKIPEYDQALIQAKAEVEQAKAQVEQSAAAVDTAEANKKAADAIVVQDVADLASAEAIAHLRQLQFDRMQKLAKQNAVDDELVDEKREAYESSKANVNVARATILTAQAQVIAAAAKIAQAKADLIDARAKVHVAEAVQQTKQVFVDYTTIVSPYTGVITHRGFHVGDFIRAADQGGNTPLFRVIRTDLMRVGVKVPDQKAAFAHVGDRVKLWSEPLRKWFEGPIKRIANSEDAQRAMRVEIDLENPTGELRDGSYLTAKLQLANVSKGLLLPSRAVQVDPLEKRSYVYVVRDGHLHRLQVETGADNGVEVQIFTGVRPDDWVVRRPGDELSDGIAVDMEEAPAADGKTGSHSG